MCYLAGVLQEAETAYSFGAPESTPDFLVGSMLFICFLVFSVVFLSLWSCPRCSPELSVLLDFPFSSNIPLVFLETFYYVNQYFFKAKRASGTI